MNSRHLVWIIMVPCLAMGQTDFWMKTNGPYWGDVSYICVDSAGRVFAGTHGSYGRGGVSVSTDRGHTWDTTGLSRMYVTSLICDGAGRLFAGIADLGVMRSTDHGNTWQSASNGLPSGEIRCLAASPTSVLYAGKPDGIFRSTDLGESWVRADSGVVGPNITCMVADSTSVFAGTVATGIFHSTDDGAHWVAVNNGFSTTPGPRTFSFSPEGDIYCGMNNLTGRLYRSTNKGSTWENLTQYIGLLVPSQILFKSSGEMFVAAGQVKRSTDGGLTWDTFRSVLAPSAANSIAIDSRGRLYVGTGRGVLWSDDDGTTWTTAGLRSSTVHSILFNSSGTLFAAGRGVERSTDQGRHWIVCDTSMMKTWVRQLALNSSDHLYAAADSGLFLSTNDGASWRRLYPMAPSYICITRSNHILAEFTSGTLARSTNEGLNWTWVGSFGPIKSVVEHTNGDLYVGSQDRVRRSTDNGITWTLLGQGIGDAIALNTAGHIFAGGYNDLYRSTDDGVTWTGCSVNPGFHEASPLAINSQNRIFVLMYEAFHSTDNGYNWQNVQGGLPQNSVAAFAFDTNGFVYAASSGGAFRSTETTLTSVESPSSVTPQEFSLLQNYPNPFNPVTTISFSLPHSSKVTLKVFNQLGQELATLVNETKEAGSHTIQWNATGFASGVYYYQLTAGNFVENKKMLLIR